MHMSIYCICSTNCQYSPKKKNVHNKYNCNNCNTLCNGESETKVLNGPTNLILTLKLLKYDNVREVVRKLTDTVGLYEFIDLPVVDDTIEKYRLRAVIVHAGDSAQSGHYYTFDSNNAGNWFKFYDATITRSSLMETQN